MGLVETAAYHRDAKKPGSAPCPLLVIEYGTTLGFLHVTLLIRTSFIRVSYSVFFLYFLVLVVGCLQLIVWKDLSLK